MLVREAGGKVSGFTDDDDFWKSGNILASNKLIHSLLGEQLAPIFGLP